MNQDTQTGFFCLGLLCFVPFVLGVVFGGIIKGFFSKVFGLLLGGFKRLL